MTSDDLMSGIPEHEELHCEDECNSNDGSANIFPLIPARRLLSTAMARPNCTHVVMDYLYTTDILCESCGHPPRMGWLYICRQDHYSEAAAHRQLDSLKRISMHEQVLSQIQELRTCCMSSSILDQVKRGNVYDSFQIEVLKTQKLNLLHVMDQQLSQESAPWKTPTRYATENTGFTETGTRNDKTTKSEQIAKTTASQNVQKLGHFRKRSLLIPRCAFKCCHGCRPYLKDRAYIPLSAVFKDDVLPERFAPAKPPVANAEDVQSLGCRPGVPPRFLTIEDSSDESSSNSSLVSPSNENVSEDTIAPPNESPPTCEGETEHNQSIAGRDGRGRQTSRISRLDLSCPSRIRELRLHMHKNRESADVQLQMGTNSRKAVTNDFLRPPSVLTGDHPATSVIISGPEDQAIPRSIDVSVPENEISVPHGLALTEEAVETNIPDIITQP